MNRWFRDAGKGLLALLAVLTLMVQSVLPVYADTVDTSGAGYTVEEEGSAYSLDYFNRIAVNSVRFLFRQVGKQFPDFLYRMIYL